ncbi:MAG: hypothetical protein Q8J97_00635, partial [Flavobacteriaceae bacterium]|nr:hypothetical protein [Flavobacteriaceae bacterium]
EERRRIASESKAELAERLQLVRAQLERAMRDDLEAQLAAAREELSAAHAAAIQRAEAAAAERFEAQLAAERTERSRLSTEVAALRDALNAEQESNEALSVALREARDEATLAARAVRAVQEQAAAGLRTQMQHDEAAERSRREWITLVRGAIDGEVERLRREGDDLRAALDRQAAAHRREMLHVRDEVLRGGSAPLPAGATAAAHAAALQVLAATEARQRELTADMSVAYSLGEDCADADDIDAALVDALNGLGFPCPVKCVRLHRGGDYVLDQRVQLKLAAGQVMVRPRGAPSSAFEPLAKYLVHLYAPLLGVAAAPPMPPGGATEAIGTTGPRAIGGSASPPRGVSAEVTPREASAEQAEAIRRLQLEQRALQQA